MSTSELIIGPGYSYLESEKLFVSGAVVGTHSSGKTTLTGALGNTGLLKELNLDKDFLREYPDFGYGVHELTGEFADTSFGQLLVVTIPETATYYAHDLKGDPTLLTTNYSLFTQDSINDELLFRRHAAEGVLPEILDELGLDIESVLVAVVSDRTRIDGKAYSLVRLEAEYIEQNLVPGSLPVNDSDLAKSADEEGARMQQWFVDDWTKSFIDVIYMTDESEVALEDNGTRLDDEVFRKMIGDEIRRQYIEHFNGEAVVINGNPEQRLERVLVHLSRLALKQRAN